MKRLLLTISLLFACGSPGPTAALGPPAQLVAPGADANDVIVAQVNGRPVWGSCVATQAKRARLTAKQALDQCVEFELLAQTAETKQLATDRDVIAATRTALVGRLVDQFGAKYATPDSMAAQIDEVYRTQGAAMTWPELRGSTHILVLVQDPKSAAKAPGATWEAARVFATQIHAQLEAQTGLFASHMRDAIKGLQAPAGTTLHVEDLRPNPSEGGLDGGYLAALFAIPEVGRVSPVTRTPYGYHVILMTALQPTETLAREQVFTVLRGNLFAAYVNDLLKSVPHESHPELLDPPDEDPQ